MSRAIQWGVLAIVLVGVTAVWGGAYLGWRWARRRLGLDRPDTSDIGQRERDVRRSLRSLLAFDFFVMWPLGLPSSVLATIAMLHDPEMVGPSLAALLGFAAFTVAVPSLIGTARELERQRLSGAPDASPPSFWIEGGAVLFADPGVGGRARRTRYVVLSVLLGVGIINWQMTLAVTFYAAIIAGGWAAWKALRRRG